MLDLLLTNIGLLASPTGSAALAGPRQGDVRLIKDAAVGIGGGCIGYVGPSAGAPAGAAKATLDCGGRLVTPGLVDAHTHLVFGGWRQHEFAQKLAGVDYLDILKNGGGILSTVAATRAAPEEELAEKSRAILADMLRHGTTTVEAKSGYGLDRDTELKQLRVARRLGGSQPVEVVSTFMGAHAVPGEWRQNRQGYVDFLCDEMLPLVAGEGLAEFCDVFCETGVFSPAECERILLRAKAHGLGCKAHVDEIDPIGGAELAGRLACVTAEHLIAASDAGIDAMARGGTIACLLPATSFYLDKPFARARHMVEAGVPVAVATDFNPGSSPSYNLQFAMNLACLRYRLSPAEALTAATLNGAAAIGRADRLGSVEPGKQADLVLWDAPDLESIFYRYGANMVLGVVKNGAVVVKAEP